MDDQPLSQVFENAAEVLEKNGWIQGELYDSRGYCALGAIDFAARRQTSGAKNPIPSVEGAVLEYQAGMYLGVFLGGPGGGEDVAEWNDDPSRTKAEVIDRLLECAKELRNVGR